VGGGGLKEGEKWELPPAPAFSSWGALHKPALRAPALCPPPTALGCRWTWRASSRRCCRAASSCCWRWVGAGTAGGPRPSPHRYADQPRGAACQPCPACPVPPRPTLFLCRSTRCATSSWSTHRGWQASTQGAPGGVREGGAAGCCRPWRWRHGCATVVASGPAVAPPALLPRCVFLQSATATGNGLPSTLPGSWGERASARPGAALLARPAPLPGGWRRQQPPL
jgi:hypothetical protein